MNQKNNLVTSCVVALLAGLIYYVTNETPVKDFIPQITEVNTHIKIDPRGDNEEPTLASVIHYEFIDNLDNTAENRQSARRERREHITVTVSTDGEEHLLRHVGEEETANDLEVVQISFEEGMDLLKGAPTVKHDKEDPILSKLRIDNESSVPGEIDMAVTPGTFNLLDKDGNLLWVGELSELAKGIDGKSGFNFALKNSKSKKPVEMTEVKTYERIRKFKPNKVEKKSQKVTPKVKSKVKNRILKNALSVKPAAKLKIKG